MNAPATLQIDALYYAAVLLDAAQAARDLAYASGDEHRMDEADEKFDEARAEFRRILTERAGMDADAIERRLGL